MPILQINFKLNVPAAEYSEICQSVAQAIADVPGLRWKVWLLNEQEREAGGIYVFDTELALNDYLAGPIVGQIKSHPGLQDLSAKKFDVMEEVTAITRGPACARAAAQ
jgi:Putative mono-oxygenase ydhR